VVRKVDWHALTTVLRQIDPRWASLASALTFLMIPLLAFRWQLFLQQQELAVSAKTVFGLAWAGQFFNTMLPGSTGGDVIKIFQLSRLVPQNKAAIAASVLADRITALLALVLLAALGFVIQPIPLHLFWGDAFSARKAGLWIALAATAFAILAFVIWRIVRTTSLAPRIGRVIAAVRRCFSFNGRLVAAFLSAVALHVLNCTIVFFFARSLGLTLGYGQALQMMPVVLFFVMIPVTINGHGLREVLLIAYFGIMGVSVLGHPELRSKDLAVALSLLVVGNDLIWSLPGGLLYFFTFQRSPAQGEETGVFT
jgi:uncharacterized membrane protein YbhN (UPF0104 family)